MSAGFDVVKQIEGARGRAGVITTPHGEVQTPAFIPVGTKATVKTLTPEQIRGTRAQAILSNAYHLYLQPGDEIVDAAGGLTAFSNWRGPTYTDSGGFQVMSLGAGFKKTLAMDVTGLQNDDVVAPGKERNAFVDEDGVNFRSFIDGSMHRFTPEVSMRIQHNLGADIMFAFDELTTLMNTRSYQESSVERTHRWARRCLEAHNALTEERNQVPGFVPNASMWVSRERYDDFVAKASYLGAGEKPLQQLFGVVQGAQYEDLRRQAARGLVSLSEEFEAEGKLGFHGYGIGGAIEKQRLGEICGWVTDELPDDHPRHMLGISEPDDIFAAVENGADTFDCVAPTRLARRGGVYTLDGRMTLTNARFKTDFRPIDAEVASYTTLNFSRAYLHHLLKAKEYLAGTLCTIHNVYFMVSLVDNIRQSIMEDRFHEYRDEFLGRYYANGGRATAEK
ncbi:tRNA guanosine(34) transglycosylase Tgt [Corynebacterium sp. H78]|uniref:tRNA guanosine(34) transglycosylase Tgt n=1 Tax=Corynebacterium sp. H78 TaxID=3133417 RepID=UPI0030ADDC87